MKIFLALAFYNFLRVKHRSVCFVKINVVKFALDLGVMKTKIASLSKKPNDLLRAQADIEKRFPFSAIKRPYSK